MKMAARTRKLSASSKSVGSMAGDWSDFIGRHKKHGRGSSRLGPQALSTV